MNHFKLFLKQFSTSFALLWVPFLSVYEFIREDEPTFWDYFFAIELIMKGNTSGAAYRTVWVKPTEGDMIEGIAPGKWDAYWAKMSECIVEYKEHSAGRFLSGQGNPKKGDVMHIWDFKASDRNKFKMAQEKMLKELKKDFEGRFVGFGTYDINKPDGATHWAAVSGKSEEDHIKLLEKLEKMSEFYSFLDNRGPVEDIRDYETYILELYE